MRIGQQKGVAVVDQRSLEISFWMASILRSCKATLSL
jgi:hypothetical protein